MTAERIEFKLICRFFINALNFPLRGVGNFRTETRVTFPQYRSLVRLIRSMKLSKSPSPLFQTVDDMQPACNVLAITLSMTRKILPDAGLQLVEEPGCNTTLSHTVTLLLALKFLNR